MNETPFLPSDFDLDSLLEEHPPMAPMWSGLFSVPSTPMPSSSQQTPMPMLAPPLPAPAPPASIAPSQMLLMQPPPGMAIGVPLMDATEQDIDGLSQPGVTVSIDRAHEGYVYFAMGALVRRIPRPSGIISTSPLARYRVIREQDRSVRFVFDLQESLRLLNYPTFNAALSSVVGRETAERVHELALQRIQQCRDQERPEPALIDSARDVVFEELQSREAIQLFDWQNMRLEAHYLSRYLENPQEFFASPFGARFYIEVARRLSRCANVVEMYLQDVITLRELKRWVRDPMRNNLSPDNGPIDPRLLEFLPSDIEVPLPACLAPNSGLEDRDFEIAKRIYRKLLENHNSGFLYVNLKDIEAQRFVKQILIPAEIIEFKQQTANGERFYRLCNETWDRSRLRMVLQALLTNEGAGELAGAHQMLVQDAALPPEYEGRESHELLARLESCRALLFSHPLECQRHVIDEVCQMARWVVAPEEIADVMKRIEEGTYFQQPSPHHFDTLPLLVIRRVHLWSLRELVALLCKFYLRDNVGFSGEFAAVINDLDRVPRLIIEGDLNGDMPLTQDLVDIFETLAAREERIKEALVKPEVKLPELAKPDENAALRILREITRPVAPHKWRAVMRIFRDEMNKPDGMGCIQVTNQPTADVCTMVDSASGLAHWRCSQKPLCLSRKMLSARPSPQQLYYYWSISAHQTLYLEADTIKAVMDAIFNQFRPLPTAGGVVQN